MNGALCEMSCDYNLPNTQSAGSTDAPDGGSQAILEKVITALPAVMSGPDLIVGVGEIESAFIPE
jgi:trimethylamine:corrinoid methyltransferase-like protein